MSIEALKLALEALETLMLERGSIYDKAITAIKEALAQPAPVQEPVAWMDASRFEELRNGFTVMTTLTKKKAFFDDIAIYTTPPQRIPQDVPQIPQKDSSNESAYQRGYLDGMSKRPQPLTDKQIADIISGQFAERNYWVKFARAVEAAHDIKGKA